eukprot:Nitzschia sp. Nitz4//scaffold246_size28974//23364//25007//NITZ4_008088-RA/size28974-processed-gene-0.17-mRNA-1//-1//CDS//3329543930//4642//frame0
MPSHKVALQKTIWQWSLGMFVATPLVAILQGTHQLSQYRTNHGHAPSPVMPARGVAVAVNRGIRPVLNTEKPLRLLVVGDSLAAGVGMSKSGTPVLPESIARELSKALGGRAVYWTCVGTPGVSASQIVQDIHQLEPNQPGKLEILFRDWQLKLRKWQERQELRRRLTDLEIGDSTRNEKHLVNFVQDWWSSIQAEKSPKQIRETTSRVVQEWWVQWAVRFRTTRQRVEEDITELKEIVKSSPTQEEEEISQKHTDLIQKGNVFRRDALDPQVVAQYDVAVVLTGLNDLKDAFMPHMTQGAKSSLKEGTERIVGGLRNQLHSVLGALDEKMDLNVAKADDDSSNDSSSTNSSDNSSSDSAYIRPPLVVVPELPIAPLKIFNTVPLCWFLIPLFRAMENNKKFLSTTFPDHVVFIPQPDLQWWSDVEAGLGPIRDNIRQERLLLLTTDIAQTALERIQKLMQQHYHPEGNDDTPTDPKDSVPSTTNSTSDGTTSQNCSKNDPDPQLSNRTSRIKSSSYVAADKMHPNDEGYELWGRHIAAAILEHWSR